TICGPSDVHDDTDALSTRASIRPHPVRDEAEVMVCKGVQAVEWVELVDLQGRRICALETSLYRGDGGTYVRLGRDMLNGSHGARGAVFVRAGVAGRVVTRAVVIE
ncbi:MAG: hypothetical protein ACKO9V_05820, partial [Candidatus Kapaibacterium sp.]